MDAAATRARLDLDPPRLRAWAALPRPTIAAINGVAFGAASSSPWLRPARRRRGGGARPPRGAPGHPPPPARHPAPHPPGRRRPRQGAGPARRRVSARRALELALVHEVIRAPTCTRAVRLLLAELAGCPDRGARVQARHRRGRRPAAGAGARSRARRLRGHHGPPPTRRGARRLRRPPSAPLPRTVNVRPEPPRRPLPTAQLAALVEQVRRGGVDKYQRKNAAEGSSSAASGCACCSTTAAPDFRRGRPARQLQPPATSPPTAWSPASAGCTAGGGW